MVNGDRVGQRWIRALVLDLYTFCLLEKKAVNSMIMKYIWFCYKLFQTKKMLFKLAHSRDIFFDNNFKASKVG